MKFLNKMAKGTLYVLTWILTYLQLYLLAAVITAAILGLVLLTVSIFSTVPAILGDNFWILFLVVSIPLSAILTIYVIVKMHVANKKLEKKAKEAMDEADKEETENGK